MTSDIDLDLLDLRRDVSKRPRSKFRGVGFLLSSALALIAGTVMLTVGLDRELVGLLGIALFLGLLGTSTPVGVAMALSGTVGLYALAGASSFRRSFIDLPYGAAGSWTLSVIPMFILMGLLLWKSGATTRMFDAARAWFGWLPGSHAITVILTGGGLAAASGSTLGIAHAVGRIGLPEMLRAGYDKRLTIGSLLMAGMPGQLIPPSLLLVVFAGTVGVPVGPQLLAGIIPGVLLIAALCLTVVAVSIVWPALAPRGEWDAGWAERRRTLARVWPVPLIVLVVIGGMQVGIMTPTEAGAVGALMALVLCLAFNARGERVRSVVAALKASAVSVGSLFLLIIGAAFLNRMVTLSGIPQLFADWVSSVELGAVYAVVLTLLIILVLGAFMESASMLLVTMPVFLPVLIEFDVNLLWYGVLAVFAAELALITPPVGLLLMLVTNLVSDPTINGGRHITLGDVLKAAAYGMVVAVIVGVILIAVPELSTWLPSISSTN